jgi:hypothetical protein
MTVSALSIDPVLIFALVCFVHICYWWLLANYVSGWQALASRFRTQALPDPKAPAFAMPWFFSWRNAYSSVCLRYWYEYAGMIRIAAAEDALYLSVASICRPGHPPLAIPWSEIAAGVENHFLRTYINLRLGNSEQIPLRLSESVANQLGLYQRFPQLGSCDMPSEKDFTTLTDAAAARIAHNVIHHDNDSTR